MSKHFWLARENLNLSKMETFLFITITSNLLEFLRLLIYNIRCTKFSLWLEFDDKFWQLIDSISPGNLYFFSPLELILFLYFKNVFSILMDLSKRQLILTSRTPIIFRTFLTEIIISHLMLLRALLQVILLFFFFSAFLQLFSS